MRVTCVYIGCNIYNFGRNQNNAAITAMIVYFQVKEFNWSES